MGVETAWEEVGARKRAAFERLKTKKCLTPQRHASCGKKDKSHYDDDDECVLRNNRKVRIQYMIVIR